MESFKDHLLYLKKTAARLRVDILEMLHKAGSGHLGGSLSMVELLVSLYYGRLPGGPILRYDSGKPGWEGQDYFILSKGHGVPAWYAVLADRGFFDKSELDYFRQVNSMLQAYPNKKVPGICVSSGAPGFGLGAAVGLAMALKLDKLDNRVFCMAGDGELQEGRVWEALLCAAQYKLDNLVVLVDYNGLQAEGTVRAVINVDPIADKFQYFGWKTVPVNDGHDFDELLSALERAMEVTRKPTVIIAKTIKGKGVLFAENKAYYHAEVLSRQEMDEAMPKLKAELSKLNN
jgi:transketolase